MSFTHMTACHLAWSPPAKTVQCYTISICPSTCLGTRFHKISLKLASATSRFRRAPIVSLFGGKGKSENENEGSPWKALEKAVGNFKKDQSLEDVLRQQIQKQEYYDDGDSSGKRPGGGSGGGGGGGGDDEGLSGFWDEFGQVILATTAFIFLYIYIIEGEEITVLAKDLLRFVFTRQKSFRLRRLMDQWSSFLQTMKEKPEFEDPYWLEHEIINTPTCYDHPAKYKWLAKVIESIPNSNDDDNDE